MFDKNTLNGTLVNRLRGKCTLVHLSEEQFGKDEEKPLKECLSDIEVRRLIVVIS
jgi:hypothetical protein